MEEKPKNKVGRPTKYCPALVDRICHLVATNTCGLKELCKKHEEMPDDTTIQDWRYIYPEFSIRYAQAKSKQSELVVETIADLIKETPTYIDEKGVERIDPGIFARQRLLADTHKWFATKLAPKLYGERQQVDTTVTIKHEDALKDLA